MEQPVKPPLLTPEAAAKAGAHAVHESHEGVYIAAYAFLAAFTVIEVLFTYTTFAKIVLAIILLTLAGTKAALVAVFYMHLRWEKRLLAFVFAGPILIGTLAVLMFQQLVLR
jgi:caa(3)-type oxidase subunit IV